MNHQTPAQAAYEAYGIATGGLTHDGRPMPTWDELGDRIRHAWAAAALAARTEPMMPQAAYGDVWTELTGYVQEAVADGGTIDPAHMLSYLRELKHRALTPVREWMAGITGGSTGPTTGGQS